MWFVFFFFSFFRISLSLSLSLPSVICCCVWEESTVSRNSLAPRMTSVGLQTGSAQLRPWGRAGQVSRAVQRRKHSGQRSGRPWLCLQQPNSGSVAGLRAVPGPKRRQAAG
ncbi:hypothetical protein BC567DRAFT_230644 [Phyllosticta citribraziliensis]